jgi:hypothetical protein
MKAPRTIVVKTLLSPDEFVAFNNACEKEDISHSKKLRDLSKLFVDRHRNINRRRGRMEWPNLRQNMAMFPSKTTFASGGGHMRL